LKQYNIKDIRIKKEIIIYVILELTDIHLFMCIASTNCLFLH